MTDTPWITTLRQAVVAHGLRAISKRIGYSPGAISSVLSDKYTANTGRIQSAVEGALMASTVECPVLGDLPRQRCVEHQRAGFRATNPMRVALSRACPSCTHRSQQCKSRQ